MPSHDTRPLPVEHAMGQEQSDLVVEGGSTAEAEAAGPHVPCGLQAPADVALLQTGDEGLQEAGVDQGEVVGGVVGGAAGGDGGQRRARHTLHTEVLQLLP